VVSDPGVAGGAMYAALRLAACRGIVRGLQQRGRENAAQEGGGEKGDGCQGKGKSAGAMPSLARVLDPPTLRTPFAALTVLGSLP